MFKDNLAIFINRLLVRPLGYLGYAPFFVRHDQAVLIMMDGQSVSAHLPDPEDERGAPAWFLAQMFLGFSKDATMRAEIYARLCAENGLDADSLSDDSKSALTSQEPQ